uniref:Polyhomeotic homolog 1 n=1 Tax=Tetraodon nigroviridis TaxID=99883 RepID=H3CJQ1_TETNG
MEADGEQNQQKATTKGNTSGLSSRASHINSMSLYERQAVQSALQALQRQPNAAQYFQQLMLRQQISNAQLQNLAAVQQATLAASHQSSPSSNCSSSQTISSTSVCHKQTTVTSGSLSSSHQVSASAASTVSQSVLLNGTSGGQGQMYLRPCLVVILQVNSSLRAPLSSQLIFMSGRPAAAAAAATNVTQQPDAEPQVAPTSSLDDHSANAQGTCQLGSVPPIVYFIWVCSRTQVQNLAMRAIANTKGTSDKSQAPEGINSSKGEIEGFLLDAQENSFLKHYLNYNVTSHAAKTQTACSLVQPSSQSLSLAKPAQPQSQASHIRIPTYPQPANLKALPSYSRTPPSASTSSIPLPQLLLHNNQTLTTGATETTTTHTLVLTSSAASHPHSYSASTANIKPVVNGQTLVVQPLQKTSLNAEKPGYSNGPVPIQPKTLRLPLQLSSRNPPPILPAPPPISTTAHLPQPPHIPVQIVGARQKTLGNTQALGLARVSQVHPQANRNYGQSQNGPVVLSSTSSPSPTVSVTVASISQSPLFLPPVPEEPKGSSTVVITNGENTTGHETPQIPSLLFPYPKHFKEKQLTGSLKRKSNCNLATDEDAPSPRQLQTVMDLASSSPTEAAEFTPCFYSCSSIRLWYSCYSHPISFPSVGSVPWCLQSVGKPPSPQAVVKPNILTHLIEGFVVNEGQEPFPVSKWNQFDTWSWSTTIWVTVFLKDFAGEELTNDYPDANKSERFLVLKCEYCKSFVPASQFRGTKRFCSMTCAKRYFRIQEDQSQDYLSNSDEEGGLTRRRVPRRSSSKIASARIAGRSKLGKVRRSRVQKAAHSDQVSPQYRSEPSHSENTSGEEGEDEASCHQPPPLLTMTNSTHSCLPCSPTEWNTEEVSQFIASLQGCKELASQFLSQEIDGQALLLLKEEHLMSTMNIKLGPALKICAHINSLRTC